jgi:3',5'-cyclic AMP phosphodiesterase CpdA
MRRWFRSWFHIKGNYLTHRFPSVNLNKILSRVTELRPHHILVTGDLTNYALPQQFQEVQNRFKACQQEILRSSYPAKLDPELWTILPGNHDVTEADAGEGLERCNLGCFFKYFGDVYPGAGPNYDRTFPFQKAVRRSENGIGVRIIALDSNVKHPIWKVGINARGRIDSGQLERLSGELQNFTDRSEERIMVVLHHHPMVVPHIIGDLEDYFLSLQEADGRHLIKLCSNFGVSAILHGHFHMLSVWKCLAPQRKRYMAVIGSPSGTREIPGVGVEFLELREAYRESASGCQNGLGLYLHKLGEEWGEDYIAFIE